MKIFMVVALLIGLLPAQEDPAGPVIESLEIRLPRFTATNLRKNSS